jgi:hypothetical protein
VLIPFSRVCKLVKEGHICTGKEKQK